MIRRFLALLLLALLGAAPAFGQSPTPTHTPTLTPTETPTRTPTATPQAQNRIASDAACASAPCSLTDTGREARDGYKSVGVKATGTVTAQVRCQIGEADVQMGADLTATGHRDFETACDLVYMKITAGTGRISAWLNRWIAGR